MRVHNPRLKNDLECELYLPFSRFNLRFPDELSLISRAFAVFWFVCLQSDNRDARSDLFPFCERQSGVFTTNLIL